MESTTRKFEVGDRVQYKSTTNREWYKATVDSVQNSLYTVVLDGSGWKKTADTTKLRALFELGDDVEYFSKTRLKWYPARIVASSYNKDGTIKVKVDGVIRNAENEQLRKKKGKITAEENKLPYMEPRGRRYNQMTADDMDHYDKMSPDNFKPSSLQGQSKTSNYSSLGVGDMAREGHTQPVSHYDPVPRSMMGLQDPVSNYSTISRDDVIDDAERGGYVSHGRVRGGSSGSGGPQRESRPPREARGTKQEVLESKYSQLSEDSMAPVEPPKPPKLSAKSVSAPAETSRRLTSGLSYQLQTTRLHQSTVGCFRLLPGDDLLQSIQEWAKRNSVQAGFVQAAVGSTGKTTIRPAGNPHPKILEGKFEILSLSGTFGVNGCHLHLSIANQDCAMYGGHLLPGTLVRTTAEIIVGVIKGVVFRREMDARTGFKELFVTEERVRQARSRTPTPRGSRSGMDFS